MDKFNIMYNELIPVFDKIAHKINLDFKNGFLDDVFETDYCITRTDLPECTEDEIEICKMDWIHSIKENFLYAVIQELHSNDINSDNSEKYYEKYYDMCFDYLIDKTFEEKNIMKINIEKEKKIMNENNIKITTVENFAEILTQNIMSKNEEPWNWNDYSFVYYDGAITDDLVFAYNAVEHMWCGIHYVDTGFDSFNPNFITDIYGGGCPNIYSIDLDMDKKLIKNEFEKIILNIINKTGPILDVDEDAIVLIEKCIKEDK